MNASVRVAFWSFYRPQIILGLSIGVTAAIALYGCGNDASKMATLSGFPSR